MNIKKLLRAASCLAALVMLASCGDTNPGPSVAVFKTATVSASILTPLVPVNVLQSPLPTDVALSVTITSTPLTSPTSTTITAQPISITGYTVTYVPLNGGPAITDPSGGGLALLLPAGGGTQPAQIYLTSPTTTAIEKADAKMQSGTPNSYSYEAIVTFFGTEFGGTNGSFQARTNVTYTNGL
ncbi:hypothetical protein [Geomesophilobacter sediminis]|uniref:Lipoprotein n=1 Tax=Geomesophilobacter sediminis TaxID=2798584 RepID=A0A8J7M2I7_9BACT|nr:hypothetical protein [Geomesophilobacter sediminis]MBJ6727452.1 hypothetical protein [Geomesophilobacter sediminis]